MTFLICLLYTLRVDTDRPAYSCWLLGKGKALSQYKVHKG